MVFLNNLADFFNLIEPWVVAGSFIFQIIIFNLLRKRKLKRQLLAEDILNRILENVKDWIPSESGKQKKIDDLKKEVDDLKIAAKKKKD